MERPKKYIKFSTCLQESDYFTMCDLETERIKIQENGVTIFDDSIKEFKKGVNDRNHIYHFIYTNSPYTYINILVKTINKLL